MLLSASTGSLLLSQIMVLSTIRIGSSHGLLSFPNQRGALHSTQWTLNPVNESGAQDAFLFFPAGEKASGDSGGTSQILSAGPEGWTSYAPMNRSFRWRFGVCGDAVSGNEHLRGGRYYNGGQIVASFRQGAFVDAALSILANHQGYIEFHICDIAKCDGEMSTKCFQNGHCRQLQRASVPSCQNGNNLRCGPIDQVRPGRWYLPCGNNSLVAAQGWQPFGNDYSIRFELPDDMICEHCVLQWYWAAAHRCNGSGMKNYFSGGDAPRWNDCVGAPGSIGGINRNLPPCGGPYFPQEYVQCADIRISPAPKKSPTSAPSSSTSPSVSPKIPNGGKKPGSEGERGNRQGGGAVTDIVLVCNGRRSMSLHDIQVIDLSVCLNVSVEAVSPEMYASSIAKFSIDGKYISRIEGSPFYLFGSNDGIALNWRVPELDRNYVITVELGGDTDTGIVRFQRSAQMQDYLVKVIV